MPSSSAGTIQCHQVVLVVELVEAGEAGTLSTSLGLACVANASSGAGGGTGKGQASTLFTFVADDPHAMASLINGSGLHPHGFNASHANSHAILHKTRT